MTPEMGAAIAERFKEAGFLYVALDLEGYRQGSWNAALKASSR
jgi:PP-loop superfamily ATP-utilizing enzyme